MAQPLFRPPLDLVISAPTAAAAAAGAVGTEVWFLTAGRTWPQLGTDRISLVSQEPRVQPGEIRRLDRADAASGQGAREFPQGALITAAVAAGDVTPRSRRSLTRAA